MAFVKSNSNKEKQELERLISSDEKAKRTHEEFQARIALQEQLIKIRKAEHMTQTDAAVAAGLSVEEVRRIEKGSDATISSLLKYLTGIGYTIELRKV